MVAIIADDQSIEKALHRLVTLLQAAGARMAKRLVIKCKAGNLSIEAPEVRCGAMLIRLPQRCLVPLSALRLALVDDEIVISSARSSVARVTVAIAETMFEIYNLGRKVAQHRRASPWSLIGSHPELLSYVSPPLGDDFPFSARDLRSGNDAKVMLASFLHSRLFTHKPSGRATASPVLLPVTDFFNHHWRGERYCYDDGRAVVMHRSAPVPGAGDECFARYGLHDAYDIWIAYGFLDEGVPFVQSLATTVKLPGIGEIRFGDGATARESETDLPSRQELQSYVPPILSRKGNRLTAGPPVIPGPQAPRALRRGLRVLIGRLGASRRQCDDLVMRAEQQILDANLKYYGDLKSCLQNLSVANDVHSAIRANFVRLCDRQTARLRDYQHYAAD